MSNEMEALEMAQCAQINLDNLARMVPGVSTHPFFQLVKEQVAEVVRILDSEGERDE